ncbi:type II toxin-antitoxin system PemK/MazF family toxin [Pendulispora rubella]|uniref:Type II toxin-antitoxin system PemK/MazF family toxin n=1 Tax=Pendulispora rubella TaxID=2741070 RepID=A0ABZ2L454_9BACT
MASRGDVLVSRRRLGFSGPGRDERFVVLQADGFEPLLDTVLVAPLDEVRSVYERDPMAVRISAQEAGTATDRVVLPANLSSVRLVRFEQDVVGRLKQESMGAIETAIRVLLALD